MNHIDDSHIKEKDYDTLIKYIEWCNELKQKNTALQDKIVITITTALFGIIMVNLDKISIFYIHPDTKNFFIALIILNALTIICLLISLKTANISIDNDIKIANGDNTIKRTFYFIAEWTQYIYLLSFASVVVIFCIIMYKVSSEELTMNKKQENNMIYISNESYLGASRPISFSNYLSQQNGQENNKKTNSNNTDNSTVLNKIQSPTPKKEKN